MPEVEIVVRKMGNSLYFRVPPFLALKLGIGEGDIVTVDQTGRQVVYSPTGRKAPTKEEAKARMEQSIAAVGGDDDYLRKLAREAGLPEETFVNAKHNPSGGQ